MRLDSKDWNHTAVYQGLYDRSLCRLLSEIRFEGVFIDVGANIGYLSYLTSLKKRVRCLAIEPISRNAEQLNLTLKSLKISYTLVQAVVADVSGTVEIFGGQNPHHSGAASIERKSLQRFGSEKVLAFSLDEITSRYLSNEELNLPILVKVDTEGAEAKVIAGMTRILSSPNLFGIIVEVSPNFGSIDYLRNLEEVLGKDFSCFIIKEEPGLIRNRFKAIELTWGRALTINTQQNLLIIRDPKAMRGLKFEPMKVG